MSIPILRRMLRRSDIVDYAYLDARTRERSAPVPVTLVRLQSASLREWWVRFADGRQKLVAERHLVLRRPR